MTAVRMITHVEGEWHDGTEWRSYPPPNEVLVTTADHAANLIASGRAVAVQEEKRAAPETRPAPDVSEKRAETVSEKRGRAARPA